MRLLIDDAFATSTFAIPIAEGWVESPPSLAIERVRGLAAADIGADDAALAPAIVLLDLHSSHEIVPEVAIVADGMGDVAMRTPVRPDEVEQTPVRLVDACGGELLARATLHPFYGIEPTAWLHEGEAPEAATAQVVIVEGAEALRSPEAGYSEDLTRAWFILTAQPVVSHVFLVPASASLLDRRAALSFLSDARDVGITRRREWRMPLADREGVPRDRAAELWARQRFALGNDDRDALRALLTRGSTGLPHARNLHVTFWEGDSTS